MLRFLGDFMLKKRLKRAAKILQAREKKFVDFKHVDSVLYLLTVEDPIIYNEFVEIFREMTKAGKRVYAIIFIAGPTLVDAIPANNDFLVLSKKDLDVYGLPRPEHLHWMDKRKFDILINLCLTPYPPLDYLGTLADIPMKIGINSQSISYLDMMIEISPDSTRRVLAEQIMYYLRAINSNK